MLLYDAQTRLATAQAFSASGASTDYFDTSKARNLGDGGPLVMVFTVTTALAGTTPTAAFSIEADSSTTFGTKVTLSSVTPASAGLTVGSRVVVPLPPGLISQFVRGYVTLGGTTPTISVNIDILPAAMFAKPNPPGYASGFAIK